MYGSAVVINVFRLLINLIAANEPNQQLFLKSGYADALVVEMKKCLDPLIASGPPKPLSAEMADVMGIALEVVMACNSKQFTEKIIPMVRKLILSRSPKSQLRVVLWRILTHSMLMNLNVGFDEKDIQYLMTLAFQGSYSYPSQIERHNAINFVAVALEMTGNGSFDSFEAINTSISELKLLERQHPFTLDRMVVSSRFAAALSTLLVDNQALKIKLLEGVPSMAGSQNLVQLFTEQLALSILQYGNTTEAEELAANFCSVLLAWLPNSADAVARFLDQLLKAPFLVGALLSADKFGSGTVVIQGVCSVLLGICCIHAPSEAAVKPTVLIDAISNQIGWERYLEQLSQFIKKSEAHSVNQVPIWPDMVCAKLRSVLVITHNDMRQLSPFAVVSRSVSF